MIPAGLALVLLASAVLSAPYRRCGRVALLLMFRPKLFPPPARRLR